VTYPASDHIHAVTWGMQGRGGVRYMYMGCHTDGVVYSFGYHLRNPPISNWS
jgi:hypothetical protein